MSIGRYKKWTKEQRNKSYRLTKKAKALNWIKKPCKCEKCGQEKGIIHLHNENYDVTLEVLSVALKRRPQPYITEAEKQQVNAILFEWCWRCHMIHHCSHRNSKACEIYWKEIEAGKQYPPIYRHDFSILKRDHNI